MTATFARRSRSQLRDEILDAAADAVSSGGWQFLQMQVVAAQVGISRQTLYNRFAGKSDLAQALILRTTERVLDDVESLLVGANDMRTGWAAAVLHVLRSAESDPVLSSALVGAASGDFLPLLTSDGTEVIDNATARLTAAVQRRWPDQPVRATTLAAEATVRLALSHIVRPGGDLDQTADDIAELATRYLTHPAA